MASSIERDLVMKNLTRLKCTEEELGKLNVKENYTKKKREQIRNFVDIAKAKNIEERIHYWVIWGTPKKGDTPGATNQAIISTNYIE